MPFLCSNRHHAKRRLSLHRFHPERTKSPKRSEVVVTLAPHLVAERAFLLEQVCAQAERVLVQETPAPQVCQPALFAV
jgi:hypothetical protein